MDKRPPIPAARGATIRQQIEELLATGPQSARDLSAAVGIPEKEVAAHLEHLRQSLRGSGRQLRIVPAVCRGCGFAFGKRDRPTRPGRCPVCRGESISPPAFAVDP